MKISQTRYLEGPNFWAPYSGLYLHLSPEAASWLAWRPGLGETTRALNLIHALAPRAVSTESGLAQTISTAQYPTRAAIFTNCAGLCPAMIRSSDRRPASWRWPVYQH